MKVFKLKTILPFLVFCCCNSFAQVNIITPSPVEIGAEMTVKCAASSVGGDQVFTDLNKERTVRRIDLKVGTKTWATYDPLTRKRSRIKQYPDKPSDIPESSFTMEGGEPITGNFDNNIDTIHLTLVIKSAQPAHMLEYTCEFEYHEDAGTTKKLPFSQTATAKTVTSAPNGARRLLMSLPLMTSLMFALLWLGL